MLKRVAAAAAAAGSCGYLVGYRAGSRAAITLTHSDDHHDDSLWREGEYEAHMADEAAIRTELLDHLRHRAYVKLGPSSAAGVGVVALVDIPAATDPFVPPNLHHCGSHRSVRFTEDELRRECPLPVLEHVLSFHDSIGAGATRVVPVNACGTVAMDASWFLNHADEPHAVNMEPYLPEVEGRAAPFYAYRTTRKVRAGEELLLDYRTALPSVWERVLAQRQENALSRQS